MTVLSSPVRRAVDAYSDKLSDVEKLRTHVVIPDTQVKPGVPIDHLGWIGQYIVETQWGKDLAIIHLGDHWDFPSLSSYDQGKRQMEGRRYLADVEAGNIALDYLMKPLNKENDRKRNYKERQWHPECYLLRGNHEDRITKVLDLEPRLEGVVSDSHLSSVGWQVKPFLEPVWIDGVAYAHYFYQPMTGRPYSGTVDNRLKQTGHTFTMGHQQTLLYGVRYVAGRSQHGLIAGSCYLHDEDYKGPQGNAHWRGIIVKHQVENGSYDPMFVSLDFLCRRYAGVRLSEYKAKVFA